MGGLIQGSGVKHQGYSDFAVHLSVIETATSDQRGDAGPPREPCARIDSTGVRENRTGSVSGFPRMITRSPLERESRLVSAPAFAHTGSTLPGLALRRPRLAFPFSTLRLRLETGANGGSGTPETTKPSIRRHAVITRAARDAAVPGGARRGLARILESRSGGSVTLCGWALNLSRGGVRVLLEERVELGQELEVSTAAPEGARAGRVVWVQHERDGTIAGVAFLEPTRDDARR